MDFTNNFSLFNWASFSVALENAVDIVFDKILCEILISKLAMGLMVWQLTRNVACLHRT